MKIIPPRRFSPAAAATVLTTLMATSAVHAQLNDSLVGIGRGVFPALGNVVETPAPFRQSPSGFFASPVDHSPQVRETRVFLLDRPLSDGRNAVVTQDLRVEKLVADRRIALVKPEGLPIGLNIESGQQGSCTGVVNTSPGSAAGCSSGPTYVYYNDLGQEADQVAGDGIYSGLLKFDSRAAQADKSAFLERLGRTNNRQIVAFAGREAIGSATFGVQTAAEAAPPRLSFKLNLPFPYVRPIQVSATEFPLLPITLPATADPRQTLVVTDPRVVADPENTFDTCNTTGSGNNTRPDAPLSFKSLVRGIASPTGDVVATRAFLDDWLKQWSAPSPAGVNGFQLPDKNFGSIIAFVNSFGGMGDPNILDQFPARLLAISNRIDLAQGVSYGTGSPGELRFVFGFLRKESGNCKLAPMTVILEYKLPPATCASLKNYAKAWQALGVYKLQDSVGRRLYMDALLKLISPVIKPNAMPSNPSGSAIAQVRTNEQSIQFATQLREFKLQPVGPSGSWVLRHAPLAQTPDSSFAAPAASASALASYLLSSSGTQSCPSSPLLVLRERHCVPLQYANKPFRGGAVLADPDVNVVLPWDGVPSVATPPNLVGKPIRAEWPLAVGQTRPALLSDLRFKFALNTCNGCHGVETGNSASQTATGRFMVDPLQNSLPGQAQLAGFLTGIANVVDPIWGDFRSFNDIQRRAQALEAFADQTCEAFPVLLQNTNAELGHH